METTRMSENGQVVIPKQLREELGLTAKDRFLVMGKDDTIVMKRIDPEKAWEEFEEVAKPFRKIAEETGITRQDIIDLVREVRREGYSRYERPRLSSDVDRKRT